MKVKATRAGSWPDGFRWSAGKVREMEIPDGEELPSWLVEVKPAKKASKAKKDVSQADTAG